MRKALIFALGALACRVPAARALDFFELEVYRASTEGQGLHEIENQTTFVANGRPGARAEENEVPRHRLLRTTFEYNYGLTDKIDVAAYTLLQKPDGGDFEYAGSRFRIRGALWEQGRFPLDLGWYVEAELPHNTETDLELEFRSIVSRDFGRVSVDVNPIFELPAVSEERRTLEFNYAARVYYRLSRSLQPGVEFFGDIGQIRDVDRSREQQHYIVPVLYGRLLKRFRFAVGPGFGLTRASDPVLVKLALEYEFTLPTGGGPGRGAAPY